MSLIREAAAKAREPRRGGFQTTGSYNHPVGEFDPTRRNERALEMRVKLLTHLVARSLKSDGKAREILNEEADALFKNEERYSDDPALFEKILDDWEALIK